MVNTFNKRLIEDVFNSKYDELKFKSFIADLLDEADFTKEQMLQPIPNDYKAFIRSAKRLCQYIYQTNGFDKTTIDVLVVKLKKVSSIDRARTAQRNFIARYLNGGRDYQKDAALVVFLSEDEQGNISDDWRLSLVKMDYKRVAVTDENGNIKKVKTEVELTPAKRFSFLVEKNGAHYNTHTVQSRFATLLEKSTSGVKLTIEDLVSAFDIEKVSKEFFDEYKKLYVKMCDELNRLCTEDKEIKKDFEDNKIIIEDFAKKTMGQLVFLYFIQKKGWLGVEKDKEWGTGDKNFMRNIFDKVYCEYDNFFNDVLEHLFYEALAKKRTNKNDIFEFPNNKKVCRIPFLNGGLFEPVNNYKYEVTNITIDNNIFKEIFDTFDLYNFTVKEDEPLEKEVAVDPEMLGKVFENLLPENIRKGNGAFYTPREIVHYMCQESLINYLYNKINTKTVELSPQQKAEQQNLFKKKKIEQLVFTEEVFEEKISKEDISELIKKGDSAYKNKNKKVDTELPKTIIDNAKELDNALARIKVCDPAIGSGAFPVGMMNEIVRARSVLSPEKSIYDLKRNAIENSIYGVDLDGGAVEIAKLRFWLSLVVDEENTKTISPLPNLDYKIMQGNSLITSYEGIDFDEIVEEYKPNNLQLTINLWGDKSQDLKYDLKLLMDRFFEVSNPEDKKNLKEQIENKIVELVKNKFEEKAKTEGKPANFYEEDIRNFAKNKENRNFFPWKLFFGDAFENGGFDVVIGNPPYITLALGKGQDYFTKEEVDLYKKLYPNSVEYKGNTYAIFYDKALSLAKQNGIITYITPNTMLLNNSFKNLRKLILDESQIKFIVNFKKTVFESAETGGNLILLLNKSNKNNNIKVIDIPEFIKSITIDSYKDNFVNQICFKETNLYKFYTDIESFNILNRISKYSTTFEQLASFYNGIKTGDNKRFISDKKLSDMHIPIIRGRDIQKYEINFASKYVLFDKDKLWSNTDESKLSKTPKIILRQTGDSIIATIDTKGFYTMDTTHIIFDSSIDLYALLAMLNSTLFTWFLRKAVEEENKAFAEVKIAILKQFYIPQKMKYEDVLKDLCMKILEIKIDNNSLDVQKQQYIKEYEKQIDITVYKLYDLTYDEVLIIDKEFNLTEEEYNNYQI